ncbi:MAG: gliding motility-associated C-terminal domain-containing protein, partial [Bacteroidota bacterium]
AGGDLTLCQLTDEITLNATAPSAGTGVWTSPTGATLVNPDQPNTLAINLLEGENLFIWTLSQGSCQNFSSDTVAILVVDAPAEIAFAGGDQSVCGQTQIQLSANAPTAAAGTWQQPPNQAAVGVTILDPASPTTAVSGLTPGQNYVFTWSLSYQNCPGFSTDEVSVQVAEAPANQAFIAENELFLCDEELAILTASPPAQGSGTWTSLTGATIAEPTSPTTAATDLQLGENVFVWSLSAGGCSNYSSDTLTIRNEALEVLPDSWIVAPNQSLDSVSLVANDLFSDLPGWNLSIVSLPQKGTLTEHGDGIVSYLPYPNAFGEDELTYLVCSELCPEICDVAKARFVIDQASVPVDSCFVPNTITPNGDGFNDTFIVPCVASYPGSRCTIFNRWFDPVFESDDYQNDWGGTYEGQPVPVGTYFFVIHLNNTEGTILEGYLVVYRE